MSAANLALFWAVSAMFVITPGVDWAYAISGGLQRAVVPAVSGLLVGHLLATLLVAAGVGALIAGMPVALEAMTLCGAVYLAYLGMGMLLRPGAVVSDARPGPASGRQWLIKGVCVSGLNPKVFLLFLALMPQFTEPAGAWPVGLQIMALGGVHVFSSAVVYMLVGLGAQVVLRSRPEAARWVSRLSGAAMVVIAAALLAGQVLRLAA